MIEAIERILVPVDFSPGSLAAVEVAVDIARRLESTIDLLHVWDPGSTVSADVAVIARDGKVRPVDQIARAAAQEQMDELVQHYDATSDLRMIASIEVGDPRKVLLEASSSFDMIVMGTHGRTGVAHLLLGSVAERVVREARCPVLTIRQPPTKPPKSPER